MKHALHLNKNSKDNKHKIIVPNHKKLKKGLSVSSETNDGKTHNETDSSTYKKKNSRTINSVLVSKIKVKHSNQNAKKNIVAVTPSHFAHNPYAHNRKNDLKSTLTKNNSVNNDSIISNAAEENDIDDDDTENNDEDYNISRTGSEVSEKILEENPSNRKISKLNRRPETDIRNDNISDDEPYVVAKVYLTTPDSNNNDNIYQSTEVLNNLHANSEDAEVIEQTSSSSEVKVFPRQLNSDSSQFTTYYEIQTNEPEYINSFQKKNSATGDNLISSQSDLQDENSSVEDTDLLTEETATEERITVIKRRNSDERASIVQGSEQNNFQTKYDNQMQPDVQSNTDYDDEDYVTNENFLQTPSSGELDEEETNSIITNSDQDASTLMALKTSKPNHLRVYKLHKINARTKDRRSKKFRLKKFKVKQPHKLQTKSQAQIRKEINGAGKRYHVKNNRLKTHNKMLHSVGHKFYQRASNPSENIYKRTHKFKTTHRTKSRQKKTTRKKKTKSKLSHRNNRDHRSRIRMQHIYIFMTCAIIILIVITMIFQLYIVLLKHYSKRTLSLSLELYKNSIWSSPLSVNSEDRRALLEQEIIDAKLTKDKHQLKQNLDKITERTTFVEPEELRQNYESAEHNEKLKRNLCRHLL
ncbi:hypothetical protein NPIL_240571 [Nephila pilipes]|uniref:Uncharacterized protein n=1 Tax=Nephila pilipes TaxID=299642 RepID=A0A8X6QIW4_NEPPI|nr:hypothetical protein NPIL_240571 [Nephila pilipes]